MTKRTRAVSIISTSLGESTSSTCPSVEADSIEGARPATRRRMNGGQAKITNSSSTPNESSTSLDPKNARKQQRKERNRISAQHSRDRKKNESQELRGRLEEAETRLLILQTDNEHLREENTRFKAELEKGSQLQSELSGLRQRFEMLERLLLAGSQSQTSSQLQVLSSAATPIAFSASVSPQLSQSPTSAPVQADLRIGSETHATDEFGQLQRSGVRSGPSKGEQNGQSQQRKQQQSGEYNELSHLQQAANVDYDSFEDLLQQSIDITNEAASSSFFSGSAYEATFQSSNVEDIYANFENSLASSSEDSAFQYQPSFTHGQATLSTSTPPKSTENTILSAPSTGSIGESEIYHNDDDRFFIKQQEELNSLLINSSQVSATDDTTFPSQSTFYVQPVAGYPTYENTLATNPFFFGIPLDSLVTMNGFSSGILA